MARKTHQIKKWLPCPLWDFAGLQDWLNEQAQAGYALEKWPGFWFIGRVIFRKDPSAVHARYCLDPIQEHFGIAKLREQEAGYQELGWHYVDKIQNYYAIYRCDDPQAPDLYTDLESLSWAMKKQVRIACLRLLFWLVWAAVLFQDEWPRLLHEREAVVMELILHSDVLIPLYAILLILILNALFHGINTLRGVRRIRARLRRGEQPILRPRRYPELLRNLVDWSLLVALVLYLGCLGLSGTMRTKILSGPQGWAFPHITLQEVLPAGATLREYSPVELLRNDTFNRSWLAPEQYDVAQGGMVRVGNAVQQETRLYQESVRTLTPSLAQAVYRGRVASQHRSLELYRLNWEKNAPYLNPNLPNAYGEFQEEALSYPGLDGLTRFISQISNQTAPHTFYIGWADDRVFVLHCPGAVDSKAALELLVQRLAED